MESIGGYRIIRRLAAGNRADVLLGHAGHGPAGVPHLAAIKVFRSQVPVASIDAEISALSRVSHPHIVSLLDLATGQRNDPILILQRLEPAGLSRLLGDRSVLEAGEAVTILAPLVAAVTAMHRDGVTHGRLGASAVLFDESGTPIICGFGAAGSIAERGDGALPTAVLERDAGVLADIGGLTALAAAVLGRVPDAPAQELTRWLEGQQPGVELLARLEDRLFAFAEPAPVRFEPARSAAQAETGAGTIPHRFGTRAMDAQESGVSTAEDAAGRTSPPRTWGGWLVLPPSIVRWLEERSGMVPEWLASPLGKILTSLRSVRRRVWVVAGIGMAAMAVSFVLLQAPTGELADSEPTGTSTAVPTESREPSVTAGDDPVVAAEALLALRARCLLERAILCLDAVHQAGSAAWQSDASRIQEVQDGAELTADPFGTVGGVTLIDRMGDTALVGLQSADQPPEHATASVLMIKTEAGWRFRGLLAGPAPLG